MVINEKGQVTTDDINFQERTNTDFLKYEGPTDPKFTGSLGNIFSYKNFHLNLFLTYSFGNVVRLDPKFRARYNDLASMTHTFLNRWVKTGDEKQTNVPGFLELSPIYHTHHVALCLQCLQLQHSSHSKGRFRTS